MALNKNHEFEELDGIKCGIVERNVTPERVAFLKDLLEFNGYKVVVVPTPPPKAAAAPPPPKEIKPEEGTTPPPPPPPPEPAPILPSTFTVGVTDYTFNSINAIFGRLLKTKDGSVVTLAFWEQKEATNNDEVPYFE